MGEAKAQWKRNKEESEKPVTEEEIAKMRAWIQKIRDRTGQHIDEHEAIHGTDQTRVKRKVPTDVRRVMDKLLAKERKEKAGEGRDPNVRREQDFFGEGPKGPPPGVGHH